MCGIAGIIDFDENIKTYKIIIEKMRDSLKRRGPDQDDVYIQNNCCLAHTRLAVIDFENGKQPMAFHAGDTKYVLVYNGEIYNTKEVRDELIKKGHNFHGHSDTEVVLKSFIEWGEKCVELLNGIFAFAIWNEKQKTLFIARDKMGVKPLFFYTEHRKLVFASEIKALFMSEMVPSEIDIDGISEIMLIGPGRTPGSGVFKNIFELEPAQCGYFSDTGLSLKKYWKLTSKDHTDSFEDTIEKVKFLVKDSIERQTISDVPICTFLSGGIDSSIISSVVSRKLYHQGKRLKTFSVDYSGNADFFKKSKFQPDSDDNYIKIVTEYIGSDHTNIVIDNEKLAESLFESVEARDLPGMSDIDSSLLLFCREIKKNSSVALSGECADEIFGGYPWFREETKSESEGFPWAQSTFYRAEFIRPEIIENINVFEYVNSKSQMTYSSADTNEKSHKTQKMIRLNTDWFMQTLLERKDRMSMYSGLEVRVPFCDSRIAEYLYSVPDEFRDYGNMEKGLLREAMKEYLPEEVLKRKKNPYPKTLNPTYMRIVSDMLRDIIKDASSPVLDILRKEKLISLLSDNNDIPWYGQLMTTPQTIAYIIQINYWLKKYNVRLIL